MPLSEARRSFFMVTLSLHRLRRTRCGRALSAAALVAWLTAAMQPCLMAMDLVEDSAPAPASYEHEHEHRHGAGHAMHEAADAESCDSTLLSGCDLFPDVQLDTRAKAKQGGDIEHPPAIAIIARTFAPEPAAPCLVRPAFDPSSVAAGPPLTIRYCSFLE